MSVITQASFTGAVFLLFANHTAVFAQAQLAIVSFVQASNVACKVGRPNVKPGETVTWQGQCADGSAQGAGVAQWSQDGKPTLRFEGTFAKGLLEGKGKMIGADGDRYDGDYKGGLRHGHGVYVSGNGARFEGEYMNNQRGAASAPVPVATTPAPSAQTVQAPAKSAPFTTPSQTPPATTAVSEPYPSGTKFAYWGQCTGQRQLLGLLPKSANPIVWPYWQESSSLETINGPGAPIARDYAAFMRTKCPNLDPKDYPPVILYADKLPASLPSTGEDYSRYVASIGYDRGLFQVHSIIAVQAAAKKTEQDKQTAVAETERRKDEFLKRYGAVELKDVRVLYTNPFALEGKTIFLHGRFSQMSTATTAIFQIAGGDSVLVSDIPRGEFIEPTVVIMAVQVLGKTTAGAQGSVVQLKLIGMEKCAGNHCPF